MALGFVKSPVAATVESRFDALFSTTRVFAAIGGALTILTIGTGVYFVAVRTGGDIYHRSPAVEQMAPADAEKAEAERKAAADAKAEDRVAAQKADRVAAQEAAEKAQAEEKAAADAKAEADRIAAQKAEAKRKAAADAKAEEHRIAAQKAEADRAERAAERAAAAHLNAAHRQLSNEPSQRPRPAWPPPPAPSPPGRTTTMRGIGF